MSPAAGDPSLARLAQRLHALDCPPSSSGCNLAELADLLPGDFEFREAAVLVGIVDHADSAPGILLTRRTATLTHHGGQISFPGGRIDPDDAGPREAALREAWEEIRLPQAHVEPLGYLDPYVTVTGFRVLPLVARLHPGFVLRADPAEVDEVFEAPLPFLLDRRHLQRHAADFRGRRRHYWQVCYGDHRIWGATAAMLVNLRERIEGKAE